MPQHYLPPEILAQIFNEAFQRRATAYGITRLGDPEHDYYMTYDPVQVQAEACSLCPTQNLFNWALVCRYWNQIATPIMYKNLDLDLLTLPGRTVPRLAIPTVHRHPFNGDVFWAEETSGVPDEELQGDYVRAISDTEWIGPVATPKEYVPRQQAVPPRVEGMTDANLARLKVNNLLALYAEYKAGLRKNEPSICFETIGYEKWRNHRNKHTNRFTPLRMPQSYLVYSPIRIPQECSFASHHHHNFLPEWTEACARGYGIEANKYNPISAYLIKRILLPLIATLEGSVGPHGKAHLVRRIKLPFLLYDARLGFNNFRDTHYYSIDDEGELIKSPVETSGGKKLDELLASLVLRVLRCCKNLEMIEGQWKMESCLRNIWLADFWRDSGCRFSKDAGFVGSSLANDSVGWPLFVPSMGKIWQHIFCFTPKLTHLRLQNMSDTVYRRHNFSIEDYTYWMRSYFKAPLALGFGQNLRHLELLEEPLPDPGPTCRFTWLGDIISTSLPHLESLVLGGDCSILKFVPSNKLRVLAIRAWADNRQSEAVVEYLQRSYLSLNGGTTKLRELYLDLVSIFTQARYHHHTHTVHPRPRSWFPWPPEPLPSRYIFPERAIFDILRYSPGLETLSFRIGPSEIAWNEELDLGWQKSTPYQPLDIGTEHWPPIAWSLTNMKLCGSQFLSDSLKLWVIRRLQDSMFPKLQTITYFKDENEAKEMSDYDSMLEEVARGLGIRVLSQQGTEYTFLKKEEGRPGRPLPGVAY